MALGGKKPIVSQGHKFSYAGNWVMTICSRDVTSGYYKGTKPQVLYSIITRNASKFPQHRTIAFGGEVQLGSTDSTEDTRLDQRHTVGSPLLVLSQPHHVFLHEGLWL